MPCAMVRIFLQPWITIVSVFSHLPIQWGTSMQSSTICLKGHWALGLKKAPNYFEFLLFMQDAFRQNIKTH